MDNRVTVSVVILYDCVIIILSITKFLSWKLQQKLKVGTLTPHYFYLIVLDSYSCPIIKLVFVFKTEC